MPSPLGHALGGLAAGWLVAGPAGDRGRGAGPAGARLRDGRVRALAFAGLGMAADLDLLVGRHSQFTHSIGATIVVGLVAFLLLSLAALRTSHLALRTSHPPRHTGTGNG